jgi:hypothetical protein
MGEQQGARASHTYSCAIFGDDCVLIIRRRESVACDKYDSCHLQIPLNGDREHSDSRVLAFRQDLTQVLRQYLDV